MRDLFNRKISVFIENLIIMNSLKHFYRITDATIQSGLLALWLGCCFINRSYTLNFYFITGAWFFPSLVLHWLISTQKHKGSYAYLLTTSCIIIGIFIIGLACMPILVLELYILLVLGPIMAVTFTCTSIAELLYLRKRPISLLK